MELQGSLKAAMAPGSGMIVFLREENPNLALEIEDTIWTKALIANNRSAIGSVCTLLKWKGR
jgi:hypothetical protein